MGVLLVLIIIGLSIYLFVVVAMSIYAYTEGKDDATRYYGSYANVY